MALAISKFLSISFSCILPIASFTLTYLAHAHKNYIFNNINPDYKNHRYTQLNKVNKHNLSTDNPPPTPPALTSSSSTSTTLLDHLDFVYVVAKFSHYPSSSPPQANHHPPSYLCSLNTNLTSYQNTTCNIYTLSSNPTTNTLDLTNLSGDRLVTSPSSLTDNTSYILKLSSTFYQQYTHQQSPIYIQNPLNHIYGLFSNPINLTNKDHIYNFTTLKSTSLLAWLKLRDKITLNPPLHNYYCSLPYLLPTPCTLQPLPSTNTSSYKPYILYINTNPLSLPSLEGNLNIYLSNHPHPSIHIASGYIDILLISNISTKQTYIPTPHIPIQHPIPYDDIGHAYIITKPLHINRYLFTQAFNSSNYICRVIKDTSIFDDPTCSLYPIAPNPYTLFDFSQYYIPQNEVDSIDNLSLNNHYTLKISKYLQDRLNEGYSLHLINKERKLSYINNKLLTLSKVYDLTDDQSSVIEPKTNLFLYRFNKVKTPFSLSSPLSGSITCTLKDTPLPCDIYRFVPNKTDNHTTWEDILNISKISSSDMLFNDTFYALYLRDSKQGLDSLKNTSINLSILNQSIGALYFDSPLYPYTQIKSL